MEFVPGAHDSRAQLHIVGIERRQFSGGLGDAHEAIYLTVRLDPLLERLQLPMNAKKTRCCLVPEKPMTFLGYRIGRNYRPGTGTAYIGTRPSRESVQSICRRISALTTRRLTSTRPDGYAGGLAASTRCAPGKTCASRPRAGCVRSARPVRRAATGKGATARSEAPASAKAAGNGYPLCLPPPRQSSTLHESCRYPLLGDPFHVFHWFQDFMRSTIFAICSFQSNRDSINSLVM